MTIHQISLFLENKPGRLATACRTLSEAGINLSTMSIADTQSFGIVRFVTPQWEKARDVLQAAGFGVNVRDVTAVRVPDRPGGLALVLETLDAAGVNVEYMYAVAARKNESAVLIVRLEDPPKGRAALEAAGIETVDEASL